MLSKYKIMILKHFDFHGFCTEVFLFDKTPRSKYPLLIFCLHIISILAQCIILHHFMRNPILKFDAVSSTNDVIKFISLIVFYASVIIESICKRRSQQKMWHIYKEILQTCDPSSSTNHRTLFMFLLYLAITFFACIRSTLNYIRESTADQWHFWVCFFFLIYLYQTRVFQYVFYLELLFEELKSIGQKIDDMKDLNSSVNHNDDLVCSELVKIRRHYGLLHSMVYYFNDVFGWSHFITIIFCFLIILSEFNYMYWRLITHLPMYLSSISTTALI